MKSVCVWCGQRCYKWNDEASDAFLSKYTAYHVSPEPSVGCPKKRILVKFDTTVATDVSEPLVEVLVVKSYFLQT